MYSNIHSSTIHSTQKIETTQAPISGILLSHQKGVLKQYNRDEPQKSHAQWKKPDIRGHIFCYCIYAACLELVNPERQRAECWLLGYGELEWRVTA